MKKLVVFIIVILALSSCEQEKNKEKRSPWEIKIEKRKTAIDSLYNAMAKEFQSEKDWEDFKYSYLFQLQNYLESRSGIFTLKEFYNYQIFKKDTSYYLAVKINEFKNEIFLELKIDTEKIKQLVENLSNDEFNFYEVAVIEIDELKTIDIEFEGEVDSYSSRIVIDRYKSLFGKGKINDIKFVKEKKPVTNED